MAKSEGKIYVVGHKNPDTDSICSAISYAYLKREMTGERYEARRAGQINEETQYVLDRFGMEVPKLLANVMLQVKDVDIHEVEGIHPETSIKDAWAKMKESDVKSFVVLMDHQIVGIISTGDIAKSYMDVYDSKLLSEARTKYKSIIKTLDGKMLNGNEHAYFHKGKVAVGASNPSLMREFIEKDDLVILGNRKENQACALELDVSCIVVCQGAKVDAEILEKAKEKDIVVIQTDYDTFTVSRLINQSIPVKHFMTEGPLVTFSLNEYVDEITEVMAKKRVRDFPVLDARGHYHGMISRRRVMEAKKKRVILVDHNEKNQAVSGIDEAEILEIIDHHRLGTMETMAPVFFRNQPVGCTATIVTQLFEEAKIPIPPQIAGLLCSAIVSDTLLFRSPTCTAIDKAKAEKLAKIAGIKPEELAEGMFHAASSIKGKTAKEVCFQDFKQFSVNDVMFGVGQVYSMGREEQKDISDLLLPYLPNVQKDQNLSMVYMMLTDILSETTMLLCAGNHAKDYAITAFDLPEDTEIIYLPGVVSRKKQMIPALVGAMQQ
ncbi:MAG: putative manganese-dependent inorganic diphosphatase [Lachnospiraceae bacterium]|jgi:manganese-dependent inorganic pyrophosphatase|nr:putative manganese-dependent inorganic diphosphatase [Lachnospiraceae bacterium]